MSRQSKYWIIGGCAAFILVAVLVFAYRANSQQNDAPAPHASHGAGGQGSSRQENDSQESGSKSSSGQSQDNEKLVQYLQEQNVIMSDMMSHMEVVPSGNAALDFLRGMVPHHEAAIDMAESYLKYGGENEELKAMAEAIVSTQTQEIVQMQRLIAELEAAGETDEQQARAYLDAYNKMMSGHEHMNHGAPAAVNVEQAFAEGMLMHHKMAVDMSNAILEHTDNNEVLSLAETIIGVQEQEISELQSHLR